MRPDPSTKSESSAAQAGTIVVLIDESAAMASPIGGGTKSKSESVATAVNSMLNQLSAGPNVRLGLVGYGGTGGETAGAPIRWTGPLAGRVLVNSSELSASPVTVEQRVRRIPGAGGVGVVSEHTIQFPVWYVPQDTSEPGFAKAAGHVAQILLQSESCTSEVAPLVIHLCGALPAEAELRSDSMQKLLGMSICCHVHLGANDRLPATVCPSTNLHLAGEEVVALFDASSELAAPLTEALRAAQVNVASGARGMICQAGMADLIRFLAVAKAYAASPANVLSAQAPTHPRVASTETVADLASPEKSTVTEIPSGVAAEECDRVALIIVADRSQADPGSGAWSRRQEQVNDILGQIAKHATGNVEVGLVLYGGDRVETGLPGSQKGTPLISDTDLKDAALRVEQVTEKVSNGIGGLVEVKRSRPVFVDCDASAPASDFAPAMTAVVQLLGDAEAGRQAVPLIMHVTGGDYGPEAIESSSAQLGKLERGLVYHSIVPEMPRPTLAYPDRADRIEDVTTAAFWRASSPLAGAREINAKRPSVTEASRGLVVGAKFDLLLESIHSILGRKSDAV